MELKVNNKVMSYISLGLFLWLVGVILAPALASSEVKPASILSSFLFFLYQPVCHQLADRSFLIDHAPMAVCVRCFAVYLAGWLLSLFYLYSKKITFWPLHRYLILLAPVLLDFIFEKMQLYSNLELIRFGTGLFLGIVIFQLLFLSTASFQYNTERTSIKI